MWWSLKDKKRSKYVKYKIVKICLKARDTYIYEDNRIIFSTHKNVCDLFDSNVHTLDPRQCCGVSAHYQNSL